MEFHGNTCEKMPQMAFASQLASVLKTKSRISVDKSFAEVHDPLGKAWPETISKLGLKIIVDPLSETVTGGFSYTSNVNPETWERSYSGSA